MHRQVAKQGAALVARNHGKLGRNRGVGDVAVASGLVEFVRAQSGSCLGGVGLHGVALVEQVFAVHFAQEPPDRLDVLRLVGHIGRLLVNPVAHLLGEAVPHVGVAHDSLSAGRVVVGHAEGFADVFFGDSQLFLDAQFHGEPVGVPASAAVYAKAFLGFVAAKKVLDGAAHDVVNARHSVGRGRPFVEHKGRILRAYGTFKDPLCLPVLQCFALYFRQVERSVFGECCTHKAAMHLSSMAMGVGRAVTCTVVRQGLGSRPSKYSA